MKTVLTILTLTLGFATAQAKTLVCTDTEAGPDNGYLVTFNKKMSTVKIDEQSIAGPQPFVRLPCQNLMIPAIASMDPNLHFKTIKCGSEMADAGYSLYIVTYPNTGKVTATLNEVTIAGETPIATFNCN